VQQAQVTWRCALPAHTVPLLEMLTSCFREIDTGRPHCIGTSTCQTHASIRVAWNGVVEVSQNMSNDIVTVAGQRHSAEWAEPLLTRGEKAHASTR
jgi:hypothetical protein